MRPASNRNCGQSAARLILVETNKTHPQRNIIEHKKRRICGSEEDYGGTSFGGTVLNIHDLNFEITSAGPSSKDCQRSAFSPFSSGSGAFGPNNIVYLLPMRPTPTRCALGFSILRLCAELLFHMGTTCDGLGLLAMFSERAIVPNRLARSK